MKNPEVKFRGRGRKGHPERSWNRYGKALTSSLQKKRGGEKKKNTAPGLLILLVRTALHVNPEVKGRNGYGFGGRGESTSSSTANADMQKRK